LENKKDIYTLTISEPSQVSTCSLVLSAAGIPHRIRINDKKGAEIDIPALRKEKALYELAKYREENRNWPVKAGMETDFAPSFKVMNILVVGLLALLYHFSGPWSNNTIWFLRGAGDSTRILQSGDYFRLITALTLHADSVHLMGNCFLSAFLLPFYFSITGNGIGLLLLLLTAGSANFLNVVIHGAGHNFVGFSTAVFAVIGILCIAQYRPTKRNLRFFVPIMAGISLLALLGSGGERTDLGAHLFGLGTGMLVGFLFRIPFIKKRRSSFQVQLTAGILAVFLFFFCWLQALTGK
jgi:membrane associated rhomboid family serine protease